MKASSKFKLSDCKRNLYDANVNDKIPTNYVKQEKGRFEVITARFQPYREVSALWSDRTGWFGVVPSAISWKSVHKSIKISVKPNNSATHRQNIKVICFCRQIAWTWIRLIFQPGYLCGKCNRLPYQLQIGSLILGKAASNKITLVWNQKFKTAVRFNTIQSFLGAYQRILLPRNNLLS